MNQSETGKIEKITDTSSYDYCDDARVMIDINLPMYIVENEDYTITSLESTIGKIISYEEDIPPSETDYLVARKIFDTEAKNLTNGY